MYKKAALYQIDEHTYPLEHTCVLHSKLSYEEEFSVNNKQGSIVLVKPRADVRGINKVRQLCYRVIIK